MAGGTLGGNLRGTLTLPYAMVDMVDWWYSHSVDESLRTLTTLPTPPQKHKPLTIRFPGIALYTRTGRQSKMKIPALNKAAAVRRGAKNLAVRGVTESPPLYMSIMYLHIV